MYNLIYKRTEKSIKYKRNVKLSARATRYSKQVYCLCCIVAENET